MKNILIILIVSLLVISCQQMHEKSTIDPVNWQKRMINLTATDSMIHGTTYLSIYSHIYSQTEQITYDLTSTVSMRNTNLNDTIYIDKAVYYDTKGDAIRTYFNQTIFIAPMETVEIVINELDHEGGSGANFLFDWKIKPNSKEPFFEGVMISTTGQLGLSFTTEGKRIE